VRKAGADKASIVRDLEFADDEATFDRSFDLPAELRMLIIDYHFNSFKGISDTGPQAPLCQASRQSRDEALPRLITRCTFSLHIGKSPDAEVWGPRSLSMIKDDPQKMVFAESTAPPGFR